MFLAQAHRLFYPSLYSEVPSTIDYIGTSFFDAWKRSTVHAHRHRRGLVKTGTSTQSELMQQNTLKGTEKIMI